MMNSYFLQLITPTYTLLFFGYIFLFSSIKIAKTTKKKILTLPKDNSLHGLVGYGFKMTNGTTLLYALCIGVFPDLKNILCPFKEFETPVLQGAALLIWGISFAATRLAQRQLKTSWRMGIDRNSKTSLITTGLFSYSRNPVFIGILLYYTGLFLISPNVFTATLLLVEYFLIQIQTRLEEAHLEALHKDIYIAYKKKTKRFL